MRENVALAGFLLALMIIFQSIRLVAPLPVFIMIFIVGSTVNACLLLAVKYVGFKYTVMMSILAPIIAFVEGALIFHLMIIPIAIINIAYCLVYNTFYKKSLYLAIGAASFLRMSCLYMSGVYMFEVIHLNGGDINVMQAGMSWPQLFTGIIGGVIAALITKYIDRDRK